MTPSVSRRGVEDYTLTRTFPPSALEDDVLPEDVASKALDELRVALSRARHEASHEAYSPAIHEEVVWSLTVTRTFRVND